MNNRYVWYACYGSNLLRERFMGYIQGGGIKNELGCRDKTPPIGERQIIIPYELYFSKKSGKWDNCGVAFLRLERNEHVKTLGRAYLVTEEQFEDIKRQEGGCYRHELYICDMGGWIVKTFTCNPETEKNNPAPGYLDIIRKGIKETYPEMRDNEIEAFLKKAIG